MAQCSMPSQTGKVVREYLDANLDLPHLNASALPRAKHTTSCHVSSSELLIQVVALAHPKFH